MLQLVIVALVGTIVYQALKKREITSAANSFAGPIIVVSAAGFLLGAMAATTATLLPPCSYVQEEYLKTEYEGVKVGSGTVVGTKNARGNESSSVGGSSTQAQVVIDNTPSPEGTRLTEEHFSKLTLNGRKIEKFETLNGGWKWYVIDKSVSPTLGQPVSGSVYTVTDNSVSTVIIYPARKVGAKWEFGSKRNFPL